MLLSRQPLKSLPLKRFPSSSLRLFHTSRPFLSTNPTEKSPSATPSSSSQVQDYQPTPEGPAPTGRKDGLSIFPFIFIFAAGTALFAWTVKSREGSFKQKGTIPAGDQYGLKKPRNNQGPISH